jgi:SAM-dependent methyltransferase
MDFRQILLLLSFSMIAFILTLYFQTGGEVESMNYEQYKTLNYNESYSHSLSDFNKKISPYRLEDIINQIYERNKLAGEKTRVMELGFGNGRVLMELKKNYPEIEFYGITKEKTHTFYRRESFILTALKFNILTQREADEMALPYVVFMNLDYGNRIPYDSGKFDLIFSQGLIPHLRYTFELFNEILRILKVGGMSLHSDFTGVSIFSDGVLLSTSEAFREIRKNGIEIYALDDSNSVRFKKSASGQEIPVKPHQAIPKNIDNLGHEMRRPEMSYNLVPLTLSPLEN